MTSGPAPQIPLGASGVMRQGPLAQSLQHTPWRPNPHFVSWLSTLWWLVSIERPAINSSKGLSALAQVAHP
jgi:hypothetical protein